MVLQMFTSMFEATARILKCSRRKDYLQPTPQKYVHPRNVLLQYAPQASRRNDSLKADKSKAVDNAEVSTTDFSDGLEQLGASTDGSDTETAMIKLMSSLHLSGRKSEKRSAAKPTAHGFKAAQARNVPPGLDKHQSSAGIPQAEKTWGVLEDYLAPQGAMYDEGGQQDSNRQRLNARAKEFVPSFCAAAPPMNPNAGKPQQLRSAVRILKEALSEWEEGFNGSQQENDLSGLQQALSRLTPQEAAMVANFLDSKEMQANPVSATCQGLMHQLHPATIPGWPYGSAVPVQNGHPTYGHHALGMGRTTAAGAWAPQHGSRQPYTPFGSVPPRNPQTKNRKQDLSADNKESLSTHLRDLAQLDCARVIMVRKINHVPDSVPALESYFSKFGKVDRVMASPTRSQGKPGRVRPATVGFVVLETAEAAQAVLAQGAEHVIKGVTVLTSSFESHPIEDEKDTQPQ